MAALARRLADQRITSEAELLQRAAAGALEQIIGAESSGIVLVGGTGPRTAAATSEIPKLLDSLQIAADEGPILQAVAEWYSHPIRVEDYATEKRWPAYIVQAVTHTSVRSSLSFRLYRTGVAMGALTVYSGRPHAFTPEAEDIGVAIATHTAVALHFARRDIQFTSALASRDVIGQAKGMIMERFRVDALQAWNLLRVLSQNENTPVHVLARQLIDAENLTSTSG
ncbi:GAF and ANTAR domain-containing protein [Williamsia sp.]|uniref:GAF and ANTAR domain-containing protein n=1 Tax=Williamsia sp. TaxID=1872085 RepID=UPI001A1E363A|nr:GAF and ANTAR domain-containing protein [Williamsia sp.]MBJ7287939.1 GAF and ANTAR domain-containing protein [Williamsia sp.]